MSLYNMVLRPASLHFMQHRLGKLTEFIFKSNLPNHFAYKAISGIAAMTAFFGLGIVNKYIDEDYKEIFIASGLALTLSNDYMLSRQNILLPAAKLLTGYVVGYSIINFYDQNFAKFSEQQESFCQQPPSSFEKLGCDLWLGYSSSVFLNFASLTSGNFINSAGGKAYELYNNPLLFSATDSSIPRIVKIEYFANNVLPNKILLLDIITSLIIFTNAGIDNFQSTTEKMLIHKLKFTLGFAIASYFNDNFISLLGQEANIEDQNS